MSNRWKLILSLCDHSGSWSAPYLEAGYTVQLVDLKQGEDVRLLQRPAERVHGILAAPPCTVFAASGNRWPRTDDDMRNGLSVVDACLRIVVACRPDWWALENPRGKLIHYLGEPTFRFHPWQFGDPWTKHTCLWGDFVQPEPLFTTQRAVKPTMGSLMHSAWGGRSERTKTLRSLTPAGFSRAFFEANP